MSETAEKKSGSGDKSLDYLGAVNSLLETINDKDESVRSSIERALVRMCKRRPNETIEIICQYRTKTVKLPETQVALLLRVIESFVKENSDQLSANCLDCIIDFCTTEITKATDHTPIIQNPCLEILVAAGRYHCAKVMEGFLKQLPSGQVGHFMILHCIGSLATANTAGMMQFVKPTLETILPTLNSVRMDHVKQAYSFALGHIAEAIGEYLAPNQKGNSREDFPEENYQNELSMAYSILLQQWLPNREAKVCSEILHALSFIYPLLPREKLFDQVSKVVPQILGFYRRSMDRNAITQLLAAVLKTSIEVDYNALELHSDVLISHLFDLVCVIPDYGRPHTSKGHYEVLRCFDLLLPIYSEKILDMLLVQLRSNNERERIKALLVVTHVTNVQSDVVGKKVDQITEVLKHMLVHEKTIKVKLVLLKTIVVLAQKALLQDNEFIRYIIVHCCQLSKVNTDHGTADEYADFIQACKNSLDILASNVPTVSDLLKRELLQFYMLLDYTDICGTMAMCMAKLFEKSTDLTFADVGNPEKTLTYLPSAETVFARSLILLGNSNQSKRSEHILEFLKFYAKIVNKILAPLWTTEIPKLKKQIKEPDFHEKIFKFVTDTIREIDDPTFPETLVNKLADQLILYPIILNPKEHFISALNEERGMLLKLIGATLCYVTDNQTIESKLELIINTARQEKMEKLQAHAEFETKLSDACTALGLVSKIHSSIVLQKLEQLIEASGNRKQASGFFSFMKDNTKDTEIYKVNILAVESYEKIIENIGVYEDLIGVNEKIINYLIKQLCDAKDITMKKKVLSTLLTLCETIMKHKEWCEEFKCRSRILSQLVKIDANYENLPLYPTILKISAILIQINPSDDFQVHLFFEESCRTFFTAARQLKNKFENAEEDERNSYIAKYLNLSLPELNHLIKVIFQQNPTPAALDDVNCVLEFWIRDRNSEVRVCASHVMDSALDHYIHSVKIGCEAPSKFNQSGAMLAKIVPRCIDSYASVRQTAVDILKRILEISCIYETLTIAENDDWYKELGAMREDIATDDAKQLYQIVEDISKIIADRLSNFQYVQFCKTLLQALNDTEQSSAIGSAVVLKNFIRLKGSELFHAVPELIKESLAEINECNMPRAKTGVLKALVALAKHHPKSVCSEILAAPLPFDSNIVEFWQCISSDADLTGYIIDHFLGILSSSCWYEVSGEVPNSDRQNIATHQPFAIFCALKEILAGKQIQAELKKRFADLFALFLTSVAIYTNLAPPAKSPSSSPNSKTPTKSKFGFIPSKDLLKMNPCQVVLDSFQIYLENIEMEQLAQIFTIYPHLASSADLNNFMELLTPMASALVGQLGITSSAMTQVISSLSKYISSPYDHQRIAAVGIYSQIIPLKPSRDLTAVIMQHLNSALGDPNALVRGFCIRGMAYVGGLCEDDVDKYSEMSLTALLKGVDDTDANSFINIPLESIKGLSRIVMALHKDKLETFQVSLAIRIRPFFENQSTEIREAAILLFGDLCRIKTTEYGTRTKTPVETLTPVSEALREQIFLNYFALFLHMSETDGQIVRASKVTLRKISYLINAEKVNEMVQSHILEHGNLQYDNFLPIFLKLINEHLSEHISDFIESCLPHLKSQWPEIRGNAACIIGLLHNLHSGSSQQQHTAEYLSHKIAVLLKDEQIAVRIKAANALGFMFGEIIP